MYRGSSAWSSERGTELLDAVIHTLLEVYENVRSPKFPCISSREMSWRGRETSSFRSLSDWGFNLTGRCALRNSRVAASKSKIPNRNCRLSAKTLPYLLKAPKQTRSLSSALASESRSPRGARSFLGQEFACSPATSWKSHPATIATFAAVH